MDKTGGSCWPLSSTLARETALSLRAVKGHIAEAINQGWLYKKHFKADGRGWRRQSYQAAIPDNMVHRMHHEIIQGGAPGSPAKEERGAPGSKRGAPGSSSCIELAKELSSNKQRTFLLKDKTEFEIGDDLINVLAQAYPSVDLEKEFREIQAWCLTNPDKRKTRRGAPAFVNRWMQKAQNSNGNRQPEVALKGFEL